ncbi:fdxN element excision recombinase XisF [Calothrix sp. UHCC 0171]|uniref:fdxN element excision recombinase XisF n=1 Tax=Calothrix sp. UHCC 0171 TaxID=3110245 RepID=UPI002B214B9F|nr:fdxN element excision recombinase XisF [Calothrix sp. UHCC 0171]MEA5571959.1 fdxN element excision recombinase XisF [Calothrix sp. UHCC 0171]
MGEVIGYARESSEKQELDGNALTKQIRRLRDAGATKIFYDIAQRTNNRRDGLLRLIDYVKSCPVGTIQKLIFTRIDRLTSSIVLFSQLVNVLQQHHVKMEALDDSFDLETVGGKLATNIRVIAAEFETEMLSLRVTKDLEVRRRNKKPHYIVPFGFVREGDRYELDHTPIVCTLEDRKEYTCSQVARLVVDTYFRAKSFRQTAVQLNAYFGVTRNITAFKDKESSNLIDIGDDISKALTKPKSKNTGLGWTAKGLQLWFKNPVLAGGTAYDQRKRNKWSSVYQEENIVWHTHPEQTLITMDEREEIFTITHKNRNNAWCSQPNQINNIFTGLIYCGCCGSSMFIQTSQYRKKADRKISYYQCNNYNKNRLCDNKKMINDVQIEQQLIPLLCQKADSVAVIADLSFESNIINEPEEVVALKQQLRQLSLIPGNNPAIHQAIDLINQQIANIISDTKNKQLSYLVHKNRIVAAFANPLYWERLDIEDKRELLQGCLKYVQVAKGQILDVKFRYS